MTADKVAAHYTHGSLLEAILAKLDEAGVAQGGLTARDLAPLDHLHTRGVVATDEMIERLQPQAGQTIIDIGCGIGGPARYIAAITEAKVTGIDLTPEFIAVASTLADMTGLGDAASFQVGDALNLPFDDASFDGGYTQNVSMSVPDKARFFAEAARVLKPGARFIAGEIAQGPGGDVIYPVPWAMTAEISHLTAPDETVAILEGAGFQVRDVHDSTEKALAFNQASRERAKTSGPPVLSPLVVLNDQALERMRNSARNIEQHRAVPVEFVCIRA
ncbi:MAG: methyltransferase domain-containing protein [Rhodospirillales bacterium]